MNEKVIIVDDLDNELGLEQKERAHLNCGLLHRAFEILVINNNKELLMQKRSRYKMLWPLFWDGTCASHPRKGETYKESGQRRLSEEFGFTCDLELIDKFKYQAKYKDMGAEFELCAILIGQYNGEIIPNPKEIDTWKWVSIFDIQKDITINPNNYAPWFIIGFRRIKSLLLR